ncbi:MAG: hypothetical protein GC165_10220 [Armatimonadetes bacterium]|nr:hypothetical protein [Armatimonadota bacterium]
MWEHVEYCRAKVGPCLVQFCIEPGRLARGYLPFRHCAVTSLMAYGLEEHEAIEVRKAVEQADLTSKAAVLIADVEFRSGLCSYISVRK